MQVLCWGVRDLKNYQVLPVNNPFVEVECGSTLTKSEPLKDASKNPNFPDKQRIVTFKAVSVYIHTQLEKAYSCS